MYKKLFFPLVVLVATIILPVNAQKYSEAIVTEDVVFEEIDGLVVVEAEYFYKQSKTDVRQWFRTSKNEIPDVGRDEDGYLDGLSVFTPNYTLSADVKAKLPFLCVDPSDMFDESDKWVTSTSNDLSTYYKECYPSMRKFSSLHWIYNNQKWQGDVPILRLGEVYLIAAEAALRYNNDQATASSYVNTIRQRAAIASRANEMAVNQSDVTLDFILAERARELAGEQTRWYDLKRYGKLTSAYLGQTNPDILDFDEAKHQLRPIPQSFLDAIANPDEFGTNGY